MRRSEANLDENEAHEFKPGNSLSDIDDGMETSAASEGETKMPPADFAEPAVDVPIEQVSEQPAVNLAPKKSRKIPVKKVKASKTNGADTSVVEEVIKEKKPRSKNPVHASKIHKPRVDLKRKEEPVEPEAPVVEIAPEPIEPVEPKQITLTPEQRAELKTQNRPQYRLFWDGENGAEPIELTAAEYAEFDELVKESDRGLNTEKVNEAALALAKWYDKKTPPRFVRGKRFAVADSAPEPEADSGSESETEFEPEAKLEAVEAVETEQTKIYESPHLDPAIQEAGKEIMQRTNSNSRVKAKPGNKRVWDSAYMRESMRGWTEFAKNYPEKTMAYAAMGHPGLKQEASWLLAQKQKKQEIEKQAVEQTQSEESREPVESEGINEQEPPLAAEPEKLAAEKPIVEQVPSAEKSDEIYVEQERQALESGIDYTDEPKGEVVKAEAPESSMEAQENQPWTYVDLYAVNEQLEPSVPVTKAERESWGIRMEEDAVKIMQEAVESEVIRNSEAVPQAEQEKIIEEAAKPAAKKNFLKNFWHKMDDLTQKHPKTFALVTSIGSSVAVRAAVGAMTAASGYLIGGGIGAASGGLSAYLIERHRQSGKELSDNFYNNFGEMMKSSNIDLLQKEKSLELEIAAAENGPFAKQDPELITKKTILKDLQRVSEFKVDIEGRKPSVKELQKFLKKDFSKVTEHVGKERKEEVDLKLQEIKHVLDTRSAADKKAMQAAVIKGAAFGAVGGIIGYGATDYIAKHGGIWNTITGGPKPLYDGPAVNSWRLEHLNQMKAGQNIHHIGPAADALKNGHTEIANSAFKATMQHGDGTSKLAERITHDYLTNVNHVDPSVAHLTMEQHQNIIQNVRLELDKFYPQDTLNANIGHSVSIDGSHLDKFLQHAQHLDKGKLASIHHVLQTPGHHISAAHSAVIENHSSLFEQYNDHFTHHVAEAGKAGKTAMQHTAEQLANDPKHASRIFEVVAKSTASESIFAAAESSFKKAGENIDVSKTLAVMSSSAIALGAAYGILDRRMNRVIKKGEAIPGAADKYASFRVDLKKAAADPNPAKFEAFAKKVEKDFGPKAGKSKDENIVDAEIISEVRHTWKVKQVKLLKE